MDTPGAPDRGAGSTPLVRVRDVSISYAAGAGRLTVVDRASFDVVAGRTLGVVGESGSGKSTIARTLLAELRHGSRLDSGTVHVDGTDVFSLDDAGLRDLRGGTVAIVAQNAGHSLTPSMRVGAQIVEMLQAHGFESGRARMVDLLDQVRLPDPAEMAERYPHQLSGGQQQRVSIAMAIAARPRVLVLDEPTTALDVITQATVLSLIADLTAELQTATVIVSHDLGVVSAVADDVAVMRDGVIVEEQPTRELFANPREPYTGELLAAVPRLEPVADSLVRPGVTGPAPGAGIATRTKPLIDLRDVTIAYGAHLPPAVTEVNLEVFAGSTVALVGESGSGKSTVATAVAGLAGIRSGSITLNSSDGSTADLSRDVRHRDPQVRRRIQLIFQNADTSLNPRATIGTAIKRPLRYFGQATRSEVDEKVALLLTDVGLGPEFATRLPGQLSGGQRQRAGIARALAANPEVIIADEITTALDVSVQAEILALLAQLQKDRDLTCLFISHDLAVVRGVADHVAVMRDGRLVEFAPTETLFTAHRHPYTASLLGSVLEPGDTELPSPEVSRVTWRDTGAEHATDLGGGHLVREWEPSDAAG